MKTKLNNSTVTNFCSTKNEVASINHGILNTCNVITKIEVVFSVRRHAFISPDRMFVTLKEMFAKRRPEEYLFMVCKCAGRRRSLIKNWKEETSKIIKSSGH